MKTLEDRARLAYWRRFGDGAPIPSVDVDETEGIVELYNINGVLGAYRITDGGLRWDEELAKRLQQERDRLGRESAALGRNDDEPIARPDGVPVRTPQKIPLERRE
jgi:hypothetical protein